MGIDKLKGRERWGIEKNIKIYRQAEDSISDSIVTKENMNILYRVRHTIIFTRLKMSISDLKIAYLWGLWAW